MKQRIQKVLAAAGVESRRHVEEMVRQGRVSVNGEVVLQLPVMVDPAVDKIEIDGEPVRLKLKESGAPKELVYVLLNKPKDVYSTNVAQGEQVRAIDLLPEDFPHRVYPVGRLDADSKGLLLLTNDGDLAHKLTHPKFGVPKTYRAIVVGRVGENTIEQMSKGVWLADPKEGRGFKVTGRVKIAKKLPDRTVLDITLKEGRNRQVRRMLAKLGHKVRELTRIKFGPLEIGNLKPGAFRMLNKFELKQLRDAVERAEQRGKERAKKPDGKSPVRKPQVPDDD